MTPEEAAEEFDRAARLAAGPSAAQIEAALWAVAETEGDALDFWLDGLADLCDAGDDRVAPGYAAAVAGLTPDLPPPTDRMVLAAADVELAWLDACAERWEQATQRLRRSEHDVVELVPACRGRWEQVMAAVAEHEDRDADAVSRLHRAEDAFAAEGRWGEAGESASGRAAVNGRSPDDRMRDLRDAAAFFASAGRPDDVRNAVGEAAEVAERALQDCKPGDGWRVTQLAAKAREIALAHGERTVAAVVTVTGLAPAVESTERFDTLRTRIEELRTEFRALPEDGKTVLIHLAVLDMQEGIAAQYRNRPDVAEPLLVCALEVFRAEGMADRAHACETQLAHVLGMAGTPVPGLAPPGPDAAPERAADAELRRAMQLVRDGRLADACEVLNAAAQQVLQAGVPAMAAFLQAVAGLLALGLGDHAAARHAATVASAQAAIVPAEASLFHRALRWLAEYLWAELAAVDGDRAAQLHALERVEQDMLAAEAGLGAAQVALRRAALLLDGGQAAGALDVALPAVLALDAERTALPDATRRRSFAGQVAHGFVIAHRSAVAAGRPDVLAELLEVARGNGMPLPRAADDRSDAVSALAELFGPGDATPAPSSTTLAGASAVTGAERTALGLPATLRTPWDTVALAEYLDRARRYRNPVRSTTTAKWQVVPA